MPILALPWGSTLAIAPFLRKILVDFARRLQLPPQPIHAFTFSTDDIQVDVEDSMLPRSSSLDRVSMLTYDLRAER